MRSTLVTLVLVAGACRDPSAELGPPEPDAASVLDAAPVVDAAPPDAMPLTVVAVVPADHAIDVELGSNVSATFSQYLTPSTINATTFRLSHDGDAVAGAVAYDIISRRAVFRPAAPFERNGVYTASITTGVMDVFGAPLAADHTWSFVAGARGWSDAVRLDNAISGRPLAVIDPAGVVHVLFYGYAPTAGLYASRVVPGVGWQPAELLDAVSSLDERDAQLVVGPSGHVVAVWGFEYEPHDEHIVIPMQPIRMSRFVPGSGWSTPVDVTPADALLDTFPRAVVDSAGTVTIAWRHKSRLSPVAYDTWARRQHSDGTWEDTAVIADATSAPGLPMFTFPQDLVVDGAGVVTEVSLVYYFVDLGIRRHLWARRFTPGAGWSEPYNLDRDQGGDTPDVAADGAGIVTAVWNGSAGGVWSARFENGAWTSPVAIDAGHRIRSALVAEPGGALTLVWTSEDALTAKRFEPGQGWSASVPLVGDGYLDLPAIDVATSGAGDVFAVWTEHGSDGRVDVLARRFVPGFGWTSASRVENFDASSAAPRVVVEANGDARAFWLGSDAPMSPTRLWTSEYR